MKCSICGTQPGCSCQLHTLSNGQKACAACAKAAQEKINQENAKKP